MKYLAQISVVIHCLMAAHSEMYCLSILSSMDIAGATLIQAEMRQVSYLM